MIGLSTSAATTARVGPAASLIGSLLALLEAPPPRRRRRSRACWSGPAVRSRASPTRSWGSDDEAHRAPLVGLLLLGALGASSCTLPGRVEGPVELTATFDDVGDLVSGHSVQVADVAGGLDHQIELTEDYQAKVTMRIKDGLELPANSEAVLRTTSLLGEKFIELRPPRDADGRRGPRHRRAGQRLTRSPRRRRRPSWSSSPRRPSTSSPACHQRPRDA